MSKLKKALLIAAAAILSAFLIAFALLVFAVQNPEYRNIKKARAPGKDLSQVETSWNLHAGIDDLVFGLASSQAKRFFRDGVESASIEEHLRNIQFDLPGINEPGFKEFTVNTLDGPMQTGVLALKWIGPDSPTFIYNHGASQIPFDALIRGIVQSGPYDPQANILVVKSPFHTSSRGELAEGSSTVSRFLAVLATVCRVDESLVQAMQKSGSPYIVVAGLSMGGYTTNLHRMHFNTADLYLPVAAGTNFADAFLHGSPAHPAALEKAETLKKNLDFSSRWNDEPQNVIPLLARFDRISRIQIQGPTYGSTVVEVWETGHITTATSVQALNEFLFRRFEKDLE